MVTVVLLLVLLIPSSSVGRPPVPVTSGVAGLQAASSRGLMTPVTEPRTQLSPSEQTSRGKTSMHPDGIRSRLSSSPDIYSHISEVNRNVKGLTEGDIMTSRNARPCISCKWTKRDDMVEVPYVLDSSYPSDNVRMIYDAMETFHNKTCIRFVPRVSQLHYLNIINSDGCVSYVGRVGGKQDLSLRHSELRTCFVNGVIQHELLHALGFYHEQSRSDRDDYVRINLENILAGKEDNFVKHATNNLDTVYDYTSVMHYSRDAFSKNGEDTITPKNASAVIGQREGMTDTDILKINRLYCSSAHCVVSLSLTLLCLLASLM